MSLLHVFDTQTLLTYCVAAMALIVAPGPGQALVIARTVEGGTRAGVLTSFGLSLGTAVHTLAAAIGLSAVLATSATAFAVIKYVGAVYLIVLGVLTLRRALASRAATDTAALAPVSDGRLVVHAVATGVLNPKVAIFFLAFLPQFVHPERGAVFAQFVLLGSILMVLGFLGDSAVGYLAGHARARVAASPRWLRWRESFTGAVLIALGLRLAFVQRH